MREMKFLKKVYYINKRKMMCMSGCMYSYFHRKHLNCTGYFLFFKLNISALEKLRLICLDVCSLAISGGSFCKKLIQQRLTYRCLPYVIQCLIYKSHTTCKGVQKFNCLNLKIFFGSNCSLCFGKFLYFTDFAFMKF